jgi:hypothetical protein
VFYKRFKNRGRSLNQSDRRERGFNRPRFLNYSLRVVFKIFSKTNILSEILINSEIIPGASQYAKCQACRGYCRGVEPPPSFQNENHPCVGEDRDLRGQYRDGLRVEQSESQVRSHFYPTSRVRSYGPNNCINVNKRLHKTIRCVSSRAPTVKPVKPLLG